MDHVVVFANILGLFVGFVVVYQGYHLYRRYPFPALRALVSYIALYNLVNLLTLIAQYLLRNVSSLRSDQTYVLIIVVLGFVGFTLAAVSEGVYAVAVWHLSGKHRVPMWYVSFYSLVCTAWLALFVFGGFRYFQFADKYFLLNVHGWILISLVALDNLLPLLLLLNVRFVQIDRQKRIAKQLGVFLLVIGLVEIVGCLLPSQWYELTFMSVVFVLNTCFLLLLERFTVAYYGPGLAAMEPGIDLDSVCREFSFSARERDIIQMILKGKSNKEIEQQLFISAHTVKNHIYHIFQKAGIKSRGQLMSLVLQKSAGSPYPDEHKEETR